MCGFGGGGGGGGARRGAAFFFIRIGMGGRWRVAVVGMKSFSETDEKG